MDSHPPQSTELFNALVHVLRFGCRVALQDVDRVLQATGRDRAELVAALPSRALPGDRCECGGSVVVTHSIRSADRRIQHLGCRKCKRRHGKRVQPEASIRHRKPVG
jgi:hypothetical protein